MSRKLPKKTRQLIKFLKKIAIYHAVIKCAFPVAAGSLLELQPCRRAKAEQLMRCVVIANCW